MATVHSVYAGKQRGEGKIELEEAQLREGHGVVGDAHAAPGDMQVSLVAVEDVVEFCARNGTEGGPGDFAANIALEGMKVAELAVGTRLRVGKAVLEVTQLGKDKSVPHSFNYKGLSLLVDKGAFCRVIEGGDVRRGDEATLLP